MTVSLSIVQIGSQPTGVFPNDAVKADLVGDAAFYQKFLAEDWTRGDSDGTFYTKAQIVGLMADPKNFKTNSEKLS